MPNTTVWKEYFGRVSSIAAVNDWSREKGTRNVFYYYCFQFFFHFARISFSSKVGTCDEHCCILYTKGNLDFLLNKTNGFCLFLADWGQIWTSYQGNTDTKNVHYLVCDGWMLPFITAWMLHQNGGHDFITYA